MSNSSLHANCGHSFKSVFHHGEETRLCKYYTIRIGKSERGHYYSLKFKQLTAKTNVSVWICDWYQILFLGTFVVSVWLHTDRNADVIIEHGLGEYTSQFAIYGISEYLSTSIYQFTVVNNRSIQIDICDLHRIYKIPELFCSREYNWTKTSCWG